MDPETRALSEVIGALQSSGIKYCVGGSFASSTWGDPRATHDFDIAILLIREAIGPFVKSVGDGFVVNENELVDAIESREVYRMAQLLHIESLHKFDLFIVADTEYTRSSFERARPISLPFGDVLVASAESIVIEKLRWYELGNRVSDRQWNDIVQVLEIQAGRLDYDYMATWSEHFGVTELLNQAISEADPFS